MYYYDDISSEELVFIVQTTIPLMCFMLKNNPGSTLACRKELTKGTALDGSKLGLGAVEYM